jgi:hypothetical protein
LQAIAGRLQLSISECSYLSFDDSVLNPAPDYHFSGQSCGRS